MTPETRPPRLAETLLRWSLRREERDAVLGDLHEEFIERAARDGAGGARRWYRAQVRASLVPNVSRRTNGPGRGGSAVPTGGSMLTASGQDLRFALRMIRRRPLLMIVAIGSLGLGIAMSTGVYGLLEAAVLRPLPVERPSELRLVLEQRERSVNHNFTWPGFVAWRQAQRSFTDVVAVSLATAARRDAAGTTMIAGELVSGGYFPTLAPRLRFGRGLTDADNAPGAPPVVVLSDAEWRRQFGDETSLANRTITLNEQAFTVVGVAAPAFRGIEVGRDARFWAPVVTQPVLDPSGTEDLLAMADVSWLTVLGRLRPGVTDAAATAELNGVGRGLTQTPDDQPSRLFLVPGAQGDSSLPDTVATPLLLLLGAGIVVLLVACANVAGLLVARTAERTHELAIRLALGAGRLRLARLLLAETLVLATAGIALGLAGAGLVAPLAVSLFAEFGQAVTLDVRLDWRVVGFAALAGLLASTLAGLAPAVRLWRQAATAGRVDDAGRTATAGATALRWRRALVTAQFSLTVALVATSGLFVRTLLNLRAIPTGLDVAHVALISADPVAAQYDADGVRRYFDRATEALARVPGVRAAAYGRVIPLGFGGSRMTIGIPGYTPAPDEDMELNYNIVAPGYFDALDIAVVDGRPIGPEDAPGRPTAVVVNETMARHFWPDGRAVGRAVQLTPDGPPAEVVGVARDVKYRTIREAPRPSFYFPLAQSGRPRGGVLHVRTAGDPRDLLPALRRAVIGVDPAVPIRSVLALEDQVALNVNRERTTMLIALGLGLAAVALSAVGLTGAMAAAVSRRRREIGVRLALGARPAEVGRLVLRESVLMVLAGSAIGAGLAVTLGRLVESRLYEVGAFDPVSLTGAVAVLALVAIAASWAPARRAASIDPITALRVE
ncbi:MAG: ADOP family duplicated permease [Vicinamibacterales bacterium]